MDAINKTALKAAVLIRQQSAGGKSGLNIYLPEYSGETFSSCGGRSSGPTGAAGIVQLPCSPKISPRV